MFCSNSQHMSIMSQHIYWSLMFWSNSQHIYWSLMFWSNSQHIYWSLMFWSNSQHKSITESNTFTDQWCSEATVNTYRLLSQHIYWSLMFCSNSQHMSFTESTHLLIIDVLKLQSTHVKHWVNTFTDQWCSEATVNTFTDHWCSEVTVNTFTSQLWKNIQLLTDHIWTNSKHLNSLVISEATDNTSSWITSEATISTESCSLVRAVTLSLPGWRQELWWPGVYGLTCGNCLALPLSLPGCRQEL